MRITIFFAIYGLEILFASGQNPVAQFLLPSSGCMGENILIQNQSTQALRYEWDTCQGDLNLTPTGILAGIILGSNIATGIDMVFDGSNWYGFITSRNSNEIIRISMGTDLGTMSSITILNNINFLSPTDIKIVLDNGKWYGFVLNEGTNIIRLDFGTSLTNAPIASIPLVNVASVTGNQGLDVISDGSNWYVVYTFNDKVGVLRLSTIESIPSVSDQLLTSSVSSNLSDIKLIKDQGSFYAYTCSSAVPGLFRLSFGSNQFSSPIVKDFSAILPPSINYYGIDAGHDAGEFRLVFSTLSGSVVRINLGADLTQDPLSADVLGNLGVFSSTVKNRLVKSKTSWFNFGVDYTNGNLLKASFPSPICQFTPGLLTDQNPIVQFNSPGVKYISLTSFNGAAWDEENKSVAISSLTAPTIDFSYQNICAQNPTNFALQTSQSLTSINWDFGNGATSNQTSPTVTYSSSGLYNVAISATAVNSCSNYRSNPITIYNQPVADFILPSITPICTNQNYLLSNTSAFGVGSNPTWEWRLNGNLVSSQQNYTTLFNSPVAQEIRLKALIPGCSNEMIKTISTVMTGPLVDFSASDNCQGTSVAFSNSTTGTVTGYLWTFGDATTSSATSPSHTYSTASIFQSTLVANNSAGCQNFLTKPIKIYSLPTPDFSVGPPPFSCSNSPTPFQNNTPPLADSNIVGWAWQFNDVAGGISSQQNPSYTFMTSGTFSVVLTATSNAGCSSFITKNIAIAPSPVADFSQAPACVNQSSKFTDLSSGGVQSRLWQIASASFTIPNPSFTFTAPGNFLATLTVTGANGCSNVKMKTVSVPVPAALIFSVVNPCAGKNAVFSGGTSSSPDAIVGWNWNFAGNSLTGNPAEYKFADPGTYNVKMTTTHASGCKYTLSKNIAINPSPAARFTAFPDRGAAPLTVQFENFSQQATGYLWKFYDKVTATSTRISPVYTFTSLGDFTAELTAMNALGCSDIISVPIKVLLPSVDLVMKDFSLTNDPVTGKIKGVVTILNNSNIPIASAEVALFLADKAVVNETLALNLNPSQSATRTLSFTLSSNQFDFSFLCAEVLSDKDIQSDNNKRCINFEKTDYVFDPYPNPTAGPLRVDWISEKPGSALIVIYDGMGKKSYEWETQAQTGLNQSVHDLTFLSAGLFYLTIETAGGKKTIRFLHE